MCAVIAYGEQSLSPPEIHDGTVHIELDFGNSLLGGRKKTEPKLWMKISQHVPGRLVISSLSFSS